MERDVRYTHIMYTCNEINVFHYYVCSASHLPANWKIHLVHCKPLDLIPNNLNDLYAHYLVDM